MHVEELRKRQPELQKLCVDGFAHRIAPLQNELSNIERFQSLSSIHLRTPMYCSAWEDVAVALSAFTLTSNGGSFGRVRSPKGSPLEQLIFRTNW